MVAAVRGIRIVAAASLSLLAACGGGSSPHAPSSASDLDTKVDIGGYSLALSCRGQGTPTVVLEAGYDSSGLDTWADLMDPLAETTRVCAYDRAGTGVSDPRPKGTITSMSEADELHRLLDGAGIAGPYVIVAHSYGGFIGRLFAARYRDQTMGLVLIDSSHEDEIVPYRRYYGNDPQGDWIDGGNRIDIDATAQALRTTARDYGDLPLVVIQAGRYEDVLSDALWNRTQADRATLSTDAVHLQATGGHFVMNDDPQVIVAAVRVVVAAARTGEPLPVCPQLVAGTDATCP
jgi:pimeloyl-ACP methyl ester carboxylesterase